MMNTNPMKLVVSSKISPVASRFFRIAWVIAHQQTIPNLVVMVCPTVVGFAIYLESVNARIFHLRRPSFRIRALFVHFKYGGRHACGGERVLAIEMHRFIGNVIRHQARSEKPDYWFRRTLNSSWQFFRK